MPALPQAGKAPASGGPIKATSAMPTPLAAQSTRHRPPDVPFSAPADAMRPQDVDEGENGHSGA